MEKSSRPLECEHSPSLVLPARNNPLLLWIPCDAHLIRCHRYSAREQKRRPVQSILHGESIHRRRSHSDWRSRELRRTPLLGGSAQDRRRGPDCSSADSENSSAIPENSLRREKDQNGWHCFLVRVAPRTKKATQRHRLRFPRSAGYFRANHTMEKRRRQWANAAGDPCKSW